MYNSIRGFLRQTEQENESRSIPGGGADTGQGRIEQTRERERESDWNLCLDAAAAALLPVRGRVE